MYASSLPDIWLISISPPLLSKYLMSAYYVPAVGMQQWTN
jgi:hypothetical protein